VATPSRLGSRLPTGRDEQAQSDATAAEVRKAARELFATHGYAAVGLERVAVTAGVTRRAVYHHYGSKEGLFAAVLAEVHAMVGSSVAEAADQVRASGDPWGGFEAGCRAFLEISSSPPTGTTGSRIAAPPDGQRSSKGLAYGLIAGRARPEAMAQERTITPAHLGHAAEPC
jgi:AcrR family transcriptional regulator